MARVSIYYDKDLKEQFFMVRGDERYARSTKTTLEVGSATSGQYDFSVPVTVNVLRDEGDGTIVIYDNDTPLTIIDDWHSSDNGRTITLNEMAYDVDHILYAEYRGNNQCSPSTSNSITLNVPDTNRVNSIITIDNTVQYHSGRDMVKTITLSNPLDYESYNRNQDLIVSYDNVNKGTITTNNEGVATITLPVGDVGLHQLKIEYAGNEHLTANTVTQNISVGYHFELLSTPKTVVLNGEGTYTFSARLLDFLNNPIPAITVELDGGNGHPRKTTNQDGVVSFDVREISSYEVMYVARFPDGVWDKTYTSEPLDTKLVIAESLTFTQSEPVLSRNNPVTFTFHAKGRVGDSQTVSDVADARITIDSDNSTSIYTDETGTAYFTYTGLGRGGTDNRTYFSANFGGVLQNFALPDYIQHWNTTKRYNREYNVKQVNVLDLSNYMQLYMTQTGTNTVSFLSLPNLDTDYVLEIGGFTSNKAMKLLFAKNTAYDLNNPFVDGGELNNAPNVKYTNATIRASRNSEGVVRVNITNGSNTYTYEYGSQSSYAPALLFFNTSNGQLTANFNYLSVWRS